MQFTPVLALYDPFGVDVPLNLDITHTHYLIYHKVWLRSDENWRSSVLKFLLPYGPMLMKTKKNRKNLTIENFDKKKIVWRYGGEGAAHKIWSGSMQRFLRNLSLRTTDGRRMPVP